MVLALGMLFVFTAFIWLVFFKFKWLQFSVAWALIKPALLTPEAGARTTLHVATDPALASVTGRYFKKSAPAEPNPLGIDQGLAGTVWARTEALLGLSET